MRVRCIMALLLAVSSLHAADLARPNVLVILADDMGFSDIGCFGGEIQTPVLDGLAKNGLRMSQFYNTSRCCPTRASLLTGLYSHRAGVGHMVEDKGFPAYIGHLNERCATVAELLAPAGYRTYMVGKWHVGTKQPYWPLDRGFNRFYGQPQGGGSYFTRKTDREFILDDKPYTEPEAANYYKTDDFTDFALKFLDESAAKTQPFYMHLCYTSPHWPVHAPEADIVRYLKTYEVGWDRIREQRQARQKELGLFGKDFELSPGSEGRQWDGFDAATRSEWARRMATHAAMVEIMDRNIGRVIEKLRTTGRLDNTLILFLSDNGASAERVDRAKNDAVIGSPGSYTSIRQPWANASNTPFRFWKSIVHEGGISTPFIAHWPARIAAGRLDGQPGHVIDIVPTVLELAGVTYPAELKGRKLAPLDGRSLAPILFGKTRDGAPIFWEHEGNRAVRNGDWKLVARKGAEWELYNVANDRTELKNLAKDQTEKTKELKALWEQWSADVGVVLNFGATGNKAKNKKDD